MKIYLSPSSQKENIYATGNTNEAIQCAKISKYCYDFLKKNGFNVINGKNNLSLSQKVKESNHLLADLHVCIHTNATVNHNTTGGTQILINKLDGERLKVATEIFKELSPLTIGDSAEKISAKPEFYEIKNTNAICVYIEVEFHDTKKGSDFIIKNQKKIGEAIAKGICNYYGVPYKTYCVSCECGINSKRAQAVVEYCEKIGCKRIKMSTK